MSRAPHDITRIVFSSLNDIEEWKLGNPALAAAKGFPRTYPAPLIDDWGIVFADFAIDAASGALVCHEVNGPNGVGSDALTGDSLARAENESRQAMRRAKDFGFLDGGQLKTPVATIHAHQHWKFFRTGGEFYPRVAQFADAIGRALPETRVAVRGAGEALFEEDIAVVVGDVPSVAAHLSVDPATGLFEYRGRPCIFIGNPNLLTELTRIGRDVSNADARAFHAWRLVSAINDKALQQKLLRGTGIRPLRHFEARSRDDAFTKTKEALRHGPVVLKPNGGSGGAGVHAVVPAMNDAEIRARIDRVIADCVAKYGENAQTTAFPIRGFEFVRSTAYAMADGGHLWDLRIAVLFEPGHAQAFPVSLRLAPEPFDAHRFHLDRDQWISNVSGRQVTFLKSGMDDVVLAAVGMTGEKLEQAMAASLAWTAKAWDLAIRGSTYEDECEEAAPGFYAVEKFRA
jgi:hypothetical protein